MTRPRHRASTARHTHNWLLPTVAAGLAVLVMSTLSPLGTTAAWSDFAPLREDASIGAGQPILNIAGLEGAEEGLEHQYTSNALTKTADHVRLENVGNVALTRFDATRELSGDSTLPLHSETYFEWTFTRNGGATPPTDWSGWLSELAGLTLQPGEVAEYTVTTALRDVSSLNTFPNSNAVTTLYVGARAANYGTHTATNWSITTGIGFSQSTGHPPPQVELPANAGWFLGDANEGAPYHTLHFVVTAFPTSFNMGSLVEIYAVNNPSEKLLGGWQSFAYHPYFHIAGGDLLSVVPNPGPQVIWIEARANGAVIARAPLWVVRTGSTIAVWGDVNPTQPLSAIAFSAPTPPEAPAQPALVTSVPEQKHEPAEMPAPQPELAPEPESTAPEPTSEPEVAAPVAAPEPELTVEAPADEAAMAVALDEVSPDAIIQSATVNDEPLEVGLVDGVWQLSIPERFWAGPHEIVLTGADEHGAPFTLTIRLTKDEDGELSYEIVDPEELPSEEGSI